MDFARKWINGVFDTVINFFRKGGAINAICSNH